MSERMLLRPGSEADQEPGYTAVSVAPSVPPSRVIPPRPRRRDQQDDAPQQSSCVTSCITGCACNCLSRCALAPDARTGFFGDNIPGQTAAFLRYFVFYRWWSRPFMLGLLPAYLLLTGVWPSDKCPAWLAFVLAALPTLCLDILFEPVMESLLSFVRIRFLRRMLAHLFEAPAHAVLFGVALRRSNADALLKYFVVGSAICNVLFVTGGALIVAGIGRSSFVVPERAAKAFGTMLLVSAVFFVLPTLFSPHQAGTYHESAPSRIRDASHVSAVLMMALHIGFAVFQSRTHAHVFADVEPPRMATGSVVDEHAFALQVNSTTGAERVGRSDEARGENEDKESKEDNEEKQDGLHVEEAEEETEDPLEAGDRMLHAVHPFLLIPMVFAMAFVIENMCDLMLEKMPEVAEELSLPWQFVAAVPVVLATSSRMITDAWLAAYVGKVRVSLQRTMSTTIQLLLSLFPFFVIVSWIGGAPLQMRLPVMLAGALILSVLVSNNVLAKAEASWLEGVVLVTLYAAVATYLGVSEDSFLNDF